MTDNIALSPVWAFEDGGEAAIDSTSGTESLDLTATVPSYEGTTASYLWTAPDGTEGSGVTFIATSSGTYTLSVTYTSENDSELTKTIQATIAIFSVTFDDTLEQTVLLVPSGGSIDYIDFPKIGDRDGYFGGYWDANSLEKITTDLTITAVWVPLLDVSVSLDGELGYGMTATVTTTYQPGSGVELWYTYSLDGQSDSQLSQDGEFVIDAAGVYIFSVYAVDGDLDSGAVVAAGFSEPIEVTEPEAPDADIIRDDQSVPVQAEGDSIVVSSDGEHSGVTVTIDYGGVVMSVEGTFPEGRHILTLSQTVPAVSGYDFGFRIETTTVTVELITVHFDASRDGYDIASVSAYFVDGSSLVPVSSWFEGGMVYFSTTHNSDYVVDVEYEESTVVPPIFDDDDDYVPPIYVPSGSSSSDDDTVKIVACAAAAVVAAIMAAFLILGHRRE